MSVFTHNRCQEELEKFNAPGLVAQKKAYFEEYYKNVRVVKALPAYQQETSPSQETQENTLIGNVIGVAVPKKEDKLSSVSQIQNSDNTKTSHLYSPCQGILNNLKPSCKKVESCSCENNDASKTEGMNISIIIVETENYFEEASDPYSPLLDGNSRNFQQNSLVSNKVRQTINKPRKHDTLLKDKVKKRSLVCN